MGKVKNYKLENMLGVLPLLKVFTKETGTGLYLPQLSDEKKEKDDYKYSIVVTKETKEQIQEKYSKVLNPNEMLSDKGIKSLISNSHGTYTYESAAIAESIGKKLEEYKVASPARKGELEKEIKDLYIQDQVNKINLMIYGPPILNDSPFLLEAVNGYNKEEYIKGYSYGNYQDKGLPKNKEINKSPEPYIRKDSTTVLDINEYLRSLREGVGR